MNKEYTVKVNCEYYVTVEAESPEEALEEAVNAEYELSDLQNFEYEIDSSPEEDDD